MALGNAPIRKIGQETSATAAQLAKSEGAWNNRADYSSQWTNQATDAQNALLNRPAFSYNFNADPVYQGLRDRYMNAGNMANYNTQAQTTANTGGFGNSYSQTAGYQAYTQQLDNLMEQIPQLAQQNLNRYNQDTQMMRDRYNMLKELEAHDYSRYRDTINDLYNDLTYYQNKYQYLNDQDFKYYQQDMQKWLTDREYYYQAAVLGDKAKELGIGAGDKWIQDNGKWYLQTDMGDVRKGWQKNNGKWYYMDDMGAMTTGWQKVNGKWYFLEGNGAMATGWKKSGNDWYYLNGGDDGSMATGWKKDGNDWYYLDPATGKMVTGTQTIGGTTYKFGSNGKWIS